MAASRPDDPSQTPRPEAALSETQARALLERMRRGDPSALDALLAIYWKPLVRYVHGILENVDAAEDVVQDVLVGLWYKRKEWPAIASIRSYLYRSARNRALNEQRRLKVRTDWAESHHGEQRRVPTPADDLDMSELHRAAEAAVEALSPRQREVFVLFSRHNLSYREIQEIMGISYQTVANHMSAALRSLRQALAEHLNA